MAINPQETKNSLFGGLKKDPIIIQQKSQSLSEEIHKETISIEKKSSDSDQLLPKWQSLDKVTALLTTKQKEGLDRVSKKIMKYRSRNLKGNDSKERITANTLIRALIENFLTLEDSLQMEILSSEEDVYEWIKRIFNRNSLS